MTAKKKPVAAKAVTGTDVAADVLETLSVTIAAVRQHVERLAKAKKRNAGELAKLAHALAPVLGQLRRYDEANAHAGDKLNPAAVIAFLRKLPAAKRDQILTEVVEDDDAPSGNVLTR